MNPYISNLGQTDEEEQVNFNTQTSIFIYECAQSFIAYTESSLDHS